MGRAIGLELCSQGGVCPPSWGRVKTASRPLLQALNMWGFPFQTLVDWCSPAPCQNGGRCVQTGAYCLCHPGWSGRLCDIRSLPCMEAAAQIGEGEHVAGCVGFG